MIRIFSIATINSRKLISEGIRSPLQENHLMKSWRSQLYREFQNQNRFHTRRYARRSGRLTPVEEISGAPANTRLLVRPLLFGILVSGCSFGGCAIWQYEEMRKLAMRAVDKGYRSSSRVFVRTGDVLHGIRSWWNDKSPGQKATATIIALNVAIFCLWRVIPLQPLMLTYFTSSPMSAAPCWSMLLSSFSHYSLWHLAANMYVLWSFTPTVTGLLGKEQFVASYLTAAMVSSYTSYIYSILRNSRTPSLGASGAIMAIIGMVCVTYPNAQLSIAFVDQIIPHSFSADTGMKFLILLDTMGLVLGWKFFGHACHLGGMFFGIWYIKYGRDYIWKKRERFLKFWHDFRRKP